MNKELYKAVVTHPEYREITDTLKYGNLNLNQKCKLFEEFMRLYEQIKMSLKIPLPGEIGSNIKAIAALM